MCQQTGSSRSPNWRGRASTCLRHAVDRLSDMQEIEEEEEASCSKQQHADAEEADEASYSKASHTRAQRLHKGSEEEELARGLEFDKYADRYGRHAFLSEAARTAVLCPCLCGPCLALSRLCQADTSRSVCVADATVRTRDMLWSPTIARWTSLLFWSVDFKPCLYLFLAPFSMLAGPPD